MINTLLLLLEHQQIQQHLQLHDTARKGEGEGRAALWREEKVTAACAVGAMTSLLL